MTYYQKRGIYLEHERFEKFNAIFHNFPETHRKIKGVYLIGDFYIGASIHVRSRILSHLRDSDKREHTNKGFQAEFDRYIKEYNRVDITLLNSEPRAESFFIKKFSHLPLVNDLSAKTYAEQYKNSL